MQLLIRLFWKVKRIGGRTGSRTNVVLVNTVSSLFLKGFSVLTSFILVPLCLRAISEKEYGIVLTITSIVNWITFFDIGIGNGLRNRLSKAIAENNRKLGRKYVSTAYFYITIIFTGLLIAYSAVHPLINWYSLLNIQPSDVPALSSCVYLVIGIFIIRFILQLISVVLLADQKVYLSDAVLPISNFLSLILIFVLYQTGRANFYNLMFSISVTPIVVLIFYNIYFFKNNYRDLRPSVRQIDHQLRNGLLSLGYKFFLLQICGIIIFSTSEFLIASLFSVQDVTVYNIAYKYYGIVFLLSNMLMAPLWSAFSHAWYQHDTGWIITMIRRMHLVNASLLVVNISLFFGFEFFTKLWLGKSFSIGNYFAFALIIYNTQMIFNNIFSLFLNGIAKLNLQLIAGIAGAIINIPVTILLARYTNLGLTSICLANIISLLPGSVLTSVQTYRILNPLRAN